MAPIMSRVFKLSLAVAVQLTTIAGLSTLVQLPQALLAQGIPQQWPAKEFKVPEDIGVPGRRQQAGTRGGCLTQKRLTALVPVESYGVTVSAYPQFLFYMPKMAEVAPPQQVEFVLRDNRDDNNQVYTTTFPTTGQSGIVSISLPQKAGLPPLQLDKIYQWKFSITCNPNSQDGNSIAVNGMIKRVKPNPILSSKLQQAKLQDKAKLYAQAGIWFDALTTLAAQRRSNPRDLAVAADWQQLLQSVGLGDLAQESLVPSATTPSRNLTSSQR